MPRQVLIVALSDARVRLPQTTWAVITHAVRSEVGVATRESVARVLRAIGNPEVRHSLAEAFAATAELTWPEVLLIVLTSEHWAARSRASLEMVWSGPSSTALTARRIDQILYDLLSTAHREVFLITFSAYRVARLSAALAAAQARGVKITLLLETVADSEGQLSNDALNAFGDLALEEMEILHWPRAERELNAAGKPGKLHAKCAVIDDAVVIGSANLTDDAFNRNMEMGVVANDGRLADSIRAHLAELKAGGVLRQFGR